MKSLLRLSILTLLIIGFASCSDDDNSSNVEGNAKLALRLIDAPGDYEAVFIDVKEVEIKYNGNQENLILGIEGGVYDLLELTAGANVLLYDDEVPAGKISQIRLILGDENTIVVDGQPLPLSTPSAQQSGLKIKVKQDLEPGILYDFILDFDVDKSIVAQGNGEYSLKPVIRAITTAESGAISGNIIPNDVLTMVTAINDNAEVSTYTNSDGEFLLSGVPDGNYTVTIQPDVALEIPPTVFNNVTVIKGEVTALGEINLQL
ncbi:MAG TPA: DUF4382 domain-containing protein [Flavobacteriaceae bacterium]|nr:DUF4382 domain-containing protein [Flavobacteriaceae bacterium]